MRLTVDVVVLTIRRATLEVLLIRRGLPPFKGSWAIPGGFVHGRETLDEAAARELGEETGVTGVYLEQLYSFGDPGRDPRGRVVTVAYYALIPSDLATLRAGTDAADACWFRLGALPPLAFDHAEILRTAVRRLRNKLDYTTVAFGLLPPKLTLTEAQRVYESILGRPLDKRNFRRRLLQMAVLRPLAEVRRSGRRPAQLYCLARRR